MCQKRENVFNKNQSTAKMSALKQVFAIQLFLCAILKPLSKQKCWVLFHLYVFSGKKEVKTEKHMSVISFTVVQISKYIKT